MIDYDYTPMVNLNGTDGYELHRQFDTVNKAVAVLLEAIRAATPHGRDFQSDPENGGAPFGARYERARAAYNGALADANAIAIWAGSNSADVMAQLMQRDGVDKALDKLFGGKRVE